MPKLVPYSLYMRPMTYDDIPEVMRIEWATMETPWTMPNFLDSFRAGHLCQVVCGTTDKGADQILGYYILMPTLDECELLNLVVDPEYHGQGLGRKMLINLMMKACFRFCKYLYLEVRESNVVARHLYSRYGFEAVGLRKNYYKKGDSKENAIVMRASLC